MTSLAAQLLDRLDAGAEWILRRTSTIHHSRRHFSPEAPRHENGFVPLGEDLLIPNDLVAILFSMLALATIHALLHHLVFRRLAVYYCVVPPETPKKAREQTTTAATSTSTATNSTTASVRQRNSTRSGSPEKLKSIPTKTDAEARQAALELTREKFTTTCYKLLVYTALFCMGCYALLADNTIYRLQHGGARGWVERGFVANYQDWPDLQLRNITFIEPAPVASFANDDQELPSVMERIIGWWSGDEGGMGSSSAVYATISASPILWHYYFVLGHYFYATLMLVTNAEGPKQKDKVQMLVHHVVTILLVFFSWYSKLFRSGTCVLILHDLSDPFMEMAKLMLYSGRQTLANVWFASFAVIFMVSRCVVFPMVLAWPTIRFLISEEGQRKASEIPFWYAPAMGLCLLQCLHIFWSGLIINMVIDALTKGDVGGDIRDECESSD